MLPLRTHTNGHDTFSVYAYLHKIGTQKPYFSITGVQKHYSKTVACGCLHEDILKLWPDLSDLVLMHLSDIDGIPMHAAANGLYFIAGTFPDGLKERYHAGNSDDLRNRDITEIVRKHFRITTKEVSALRLKIIKNYRTKPVEIINRFVDEMKPIWKKEAETIIAKYGLVISED